MKKYAIVEINGKQYKVSEGEEFLMDKTPHDKLNYKVLMISDGDKVNVGKPFLTKVKVIFDVINKVVKGEKIHIRKYKAKSRYRKKVGFKPSYTQVLTKKIS